MPIIRFDWSGSQLSDVLIPARRCYTTTLSPDGNLIAAITHSRDTDFREVGLAISVFETATGVESHRILGAAQPQFTTVDYLDWGATGASWLSDSSGVVVGTKHGDRVAHLDGAWEAAGGWPAQHDIRFFASPTDYTITRSGGAQITDRTGNVLARLDVGPPPVRSSPDSVWLQFLSWGTGSELRIYLYTTSSARDFPGWSAPPLAPVIEHAPLADRLFVEVVVGTCLNVRQKPSLDSPFITCLPSGAIVETDDYWPEWMASANEGAWMHIRTDDGLEGWAHADYLRWHSDGVRLEE